LIGLGNDQPPSPLAILGGYRRSSGVTGVDATVAAWDDGQPWLDEILAQLRANRDWLAATLAAGLPGVTMRVREATYLAWLDCRALELSCPAGSPETRTTRPSPDLACYQRRVRRSSSSSRPTSGVIPERNASKRLTTPLSPTTRHRFRRVDLTRPDKSGVTHFHP
jgi:hypothetical protein